MLRQLIVILCVFATGALWSVVALAEPVEISGRTMGTSYSVKLGQLPEGADCR